MVVLSSQFHEPEQNVLILVSSHQYKVPVLSTQGFFPWFNASLALTGRSLKPQGLISFVHKVSKFLWSVKILWHILEIITDLLNSNHKEQSLC